MNEKGRDVPLVVLKSVALGLARSKLQPLTGASQENSAGPIQTVPQRSSAAGASAAGACQPRFLSPM